MPPRTPGPFHVVGWAAYLACSWTWCIGMWLPVILVRDFGWWSFPAFAAPNVLGAAAFGWALSRPGTSEGVVRAHGGAIRAFSIVTAAFQAFFAAWLLAPSVASFPTIPGAVFAGVAAITILIAQRGAMLEWSIGLLVASIAAGVVYLGRYEGWRISPLPPASHPGDLAWLMPVCALGFGLCPYLDGTFHRARQALAGSRGTAAFALGFGVFFAIMIALTLAYAPAALARAGAGGAAPDTLALPLRVHMALQLGFTLAVHAAEMVVLSRGWRIAPVLAGLVLAAGGAWVALRPGDVPFLARAGLGAPEVVYRLFMSAYGLYFPAYAWICMIPGWTTPPTHRRWTAFAFASLAATPMFWLGFIERQHAWLGPGVLVILAAKLLARDRPTPA